MSITPGPFAPTVTQHVAGTPTRDAHNNEVPSFVDRTVQALATFPGNAFEADAPAADLVTTDRVLLLTPDTTVSALDEWTVGGTRYRTQGEPAPYQHPMTGTAVTQVNLRRVT